MANDTRCVFCGKTHEPSCRDCAREMESLPHIDRCRRALQRGLANHPELLREYIEVTQSAEDHRPACGCGGKLRFMEEQNFDNTPHGDSIFHGCFTVLPGYCTTCGRFAFFHPETVRSNPFLAHLIEKDTGRT